MARIKIGKGFSGADKFKNLSSLMSESANWLRFPEIVEPTENDNGQRLLKEPERELASAKRERDILKKAVAYFAREPRHDKW